MIHTLWTDEEDRTLRQYVGKKTAAEIALIIGRTKKGVEGRMAKLGLSGRKKGDHHWNARLREAEVEMIRILKDSGYGPTEIYSLMSSAERISKQQVKSILAFRARNS